MTNSSNEGGEPKCGVVVKRIDGATVKLMNHDFRQAIRKALDDHDHKDLPVDVLRALGREWGQGVLDMRGLRAFVDKVRLVQL